MGLKFGPQNVVVLSSPEAVQALFVNRGAIYSGRPINFVLSNFIFTGQDHPTGFQNGEHLRRMRTSMKMLTGPTGLKEALPMQDRLSSRLVSQLRQKTHPPLKCISLWSFEIAMTAMMGPVGPEKASPELFDRWVVLQHMLLESIDSAASTAYDMVPFLRHMPRFMAGNAEDRGRVIGRGLGDIYVDLFARLKQHLKQEEDTGEKIDYLGLMGRIIQDLGLRDASEKDAPESTKNVYTEPQLRSVAQFAQDAATDTTISTALSFILALALHPDVKRKAQEEVDRVCGQGPEDMPNHTNMDKFPYVKACMWEVCRQLPLVLDGLPSRITAYLHLLQALRWRPPAPTMLPHLIDRDDTFRGYHIPKGSVVIGNVWAMTHDEEVFADPEVFDPERFLSDKGGSFFPFGVGRRVCPGDQFAQNSLMTALPKLVWAFDFVPDGPIPDVSVANAYAPGIVMSPKNLPIEFIPRNL